MNYHLTTQFCQSYGIANLYCLTSLKDIQGQFQAFLLSCKVDELSTATIKYYAYMLGAFVDFCTSNNIKSAKNVNSTHIRMFLLKLQETNKPVSVHSYYRAIKRFFNWLVNEKLLKQIRLLPFLLLTIIIKRV